MAKIKKYRVWIEQINQTYIDVLATDKYRARAKARAKWRRMEAVPQITWIEEQKQDAGIGC